MHSLLSRRRFLESSLVGAGALLIPSLSTHSFAAQVSATPFFNYLQKQIHQKQGIPLSLVPPSPGQIRGMQLAHPGTSFRTLQVRAGVFTGYFGEMRERTGTRFTYLGPLPLPGWQHDAYTLMFNWVDFTRWSDGTVTKQYVDTDTSVGRHPRQNLDAIPFL